jgi:hypothetical protein
MDTHDIPLDDNLSDLETRLRGWQPATGGLEADAMLYAAGKGEIQALSRSRAVWLTLACGLLLVATWLGSWLAVERAERQALSHELRLRSGRPTTPVVAPPPETSRQDDTIPQNGYLGVRKLVLEMGIDAWPVTDLGPNEPLDPPVPQPPILQVGNRDRMLE